MSVANNLSGSLKHYISGCLKYIYSPIICNINLLLFSGCLKFFDAMKMGVFLR
ncbi:MAG: hypothetical protein IKI11_04500 [Neisseriaceae bacterium]|nr:hypothetical protein [Neisseriaceae bacterium]